ncbi:hypothetical protein BDV95DRAFT_615981 [Massariosphaeria phaeospora]|uniref:F-box domain-containing protein n=1 Tax=Massariosphaeria phaeospora TaxID=100035 RepID=A0A7C8IE17_9PLEO|nr:hypothetical protein BDV95DRAFT_615981 [Massariosphaeria phaeospora]
MALLDKLPDEILSRIIQSVEKRLDLANVRLVNRHLESIAVEVLFSTATLYAHWSTEYSAPTWPVSYNSQVFKNFLEHEVLKRYVKAVTIYTCETHCNHQPVDAWDAVKTAPRHHANWEELYKRITEFPNLRDVSLCFDRHSHDDLASGYGLNYQKSLHTSGFRQRCFKTLIARFDKRITKLAIRHFEGGPKSTESALKNPELLTGVLENLTSLRLNIIHEEIQSFDGDNRNLKDADPHGFWGRFPATFLTPCQQNLKHLALYSDLAVGWYPKLDLRNIHFPNLQTLALGHFIFSHGWQFDWIMLHGSTLEALYFDHCAILYQIGSTIPGGWLDAEGYPVIPPVDYFIHIPSSAHPNLENDKSLSETTTFKSYDTQWHSVFDRFTDALPRLHDFRFGSSLEWDSSIKSRLGDSIGMAVMPWEAESKIENELFQQRYVQYNDWGDYYDTEWWMAGWDEAMMAQAQPPPDCLEQDKTALQALLITLGCSTRLAEPSPLTVRRRTGKIHSRI